MSKAADSSANQRIERDSLGERSVPREALFGIHTLRAKENFPLSGRPVHPALVRAYGWVKCACARVNAELGEIPAELLPPLETACRELAEGRWTDSVIVDALQGGAGTSTNANVNEVIANRTLQILGHDLGAYDIVSPSNHVNRNQSTNDTFPTALRVAALFLLDELERSLVVLQEAFQDAEKRMSHVVKVGRTQLQDAVLITLGREMGAYAEAFARDRWRVFKCRERLRVVNLGGTAVGTGVGAPRRYIFRVVDELRSLTGLGLARAENLVEATQNTDVFVEVSGILSAAASNLSKVCFDLRLLSSGPAAGLGELRLPALQEGSSIMPGKVNPVVPEAVTQVAMRVFAAHSTITLASSSGSLELNPFLPLLADELLTSLDLLGRGCRLLAERCVRGMQPDEAACARHIASSTAAVTALVSVIGYTRANEVAQTIRETGAVVRDVVVQRGWLTEAEFDELVRPESVNRLGHPS